MSCKSKVMFRPMSALTQSMAQCNERTALANQTHATRQTLGVELAVTAQWKTKAFFLWLCQLISCYDTAPGVDLQGVQNY